MAAKKNPAATPNSGTRRRSKLRHRSAMVWAFLHLFATTTLLAIFCAFFLSERAVEVIPLALSDPQISGQLLPPLLVLVGLAACTWALIYIVGMLVKQRLRERRSPGRVSLKTSAGTIMTETLIVLPVFFMLTFGLAQMGVNSIASFLTTLGAYEAARTVGVWGVEVGNDRSPGGPTNDTIVREKARLAAALVIAPVTPELASGLAGCDQGDSLPKMRAGMVGAGLLPMGAPEPFIRTMHVAFGRKPFAERGPIKLTLAYCANDVSWTAIDSNPDYTGFSTYTTTLTYHHPAAFPLVGPIFGPSGQGAGGWAPTTYVTSFQREYEMTTQLTPNPRLP